MKLVFFLTVSRKIEETNFPQQSLLINGMLVRGEKCSKPNYTGFDNWKNLEKLGAFYEIKFPKN